LTIINILDALRARYGTDSRAACALNITRQALALLRNGTNHASDQTIIRACALLNIDPAATLASNRADAATDDATRAAWTKISYQLATATNAPEKNSLENTMTKDQKPAENRPSNTNYAK
jgi:transcriptional regulator with XRE-family HTH domain